MLRVIAAPTRPMPSTAGPPWLTLACSGMQLDFGLGLSRTAPQLTGTIPAAFGGLTALRRWSLPRMTLQVRSRGGRRVELPYKVCSSGFQSRLVCSNLRWGFQLRKAGCPVGLQGWMWACQRFSLQRSFVPQATLPPALVSLRSLEQVELQDNQLSGALPAWAGNLPNGQVISSCMWLQCDPDLRAVCALGFGCASHNASKQPVVVVPAATAGVHLLVCIMVLTHFAGCCHRLCAWTTTCSLARSRPRGAQQRPQSPHTPWRCQPTQVRYPAGHHRLDVMLSAHMAAVWHSDSLIICEPNFHR